MSCTNRGNPIHPIKIGSRDSKLAMVQAEQVMSLLGVERCVLVTMKTTGDQILDRTLDQVGGKGLFVKELDRALAAGAVDLTVHSLKDVPAEQPAGLPLLAFPKREDARDVLVLPEGVPLADWDTTKPIGCSSARRQVQLAVLFPNVAVKPVRGNVQTRLSKLDSGEYGALILAAAGLNRLGLSHRIARYFSPDEITPAAGQGILAVQGRAGELAEEAALLDDPDAHVCALAERAFVHTLDGSCFAPIAAYAEVQGDLLHLQACYVPPQQTDILRGALTGAKRDAQSLGRTLAYQLQQQAQGAILP